MKPWIPNDIIAGVLAALLILGVAVLFALVVGKLPLP